MKKILVFLLTAIFVFPQAGKDLKYLLWERETEFRKSGASFSNVHQIINILSRKGARKFSVLSFIYDPATTGLKILYVKLRKKSGKEISLDLSRAKDLPMPAGIIFWNRRHKVIEAKGISPGDILDIKYRTWGFRIAYLENSQEEKEIVPPLRGHFYEIVYLSSRYPIKLMRYKLWGPSDVQLSYEVFNGTLRVSKMIKDNIAYFTWEKKDIKPFKYEPMMPSFSDVAEKIIVTSLHQWKVKSKWFFNISEPSLKPDKNIRELVQELLKGTKDNEKKIFILTHWVAQNIRYLGLWLGPNEGYTPNPAPFTLRARAGVCKDKAALLVSMLRMAGFPAFQVMTEAGSRVENIVADQFNHSVTAIKLNSKKRKFRLLDPTWAPQSRELWSSREQLQYYLVGTPEGEKLMETPPFPAEKNYLRVRLKGKISGNVLSGEILINTDNHYGTLFRRKINISPLSMRNSIFYRLVNDISPFSRINGIKKENTFNFSKPFMAKIKFRIPYYLRGNLMFSPLSSFPPRIFNEFLKVSPAERKNPIRLANTRKIIMEEKISLPKGLYVVRLPKNIKANCKEASFKANFWKKGRTIGAKYVFMNNSKIIKDIKGFKNVIKALRNAQVSLYILNTGGK